MSQQKKALGFWARGQAKFGAQKIFGLGWASSTKERQKMFLVVYSGLTHINQYLNFSVSNVIYRYMRCDKKETRLHLSHSWLNEFQTFFQCSVSNACQNFVALCCVCLQPVLLVLTQLLVTQE